MEKWEFRRKIKLGAKKSEMSIIQINQHTNTTCESLQEKIRKKILVIFSRIKWIAFDSRSSIHCSTINLRTTKIKLSLDVSSKWKLGLFPLLIVSNFYVSKINHNRFPFLHSNPIVRIVYRNYLKTTDNPISMQLFDLCTMIIKMWKIFPIEQHTW